MGGVDRRPARVKQCKLPSYSATASHVDDPALARAVSLHCMTVVLILFKSSRVSDDQTSVGCASTAADLEHIRCGLESVHTAGKRSACGKQSNK